MALPGEVACAPICSRQHGAKSAAARSLARHLCPRCGAPQFPVHSGSLNCELGRNGSMVKRAVAAHRRTLPSLPRLPSHTTCVWPLAQQRSVGGRKASLLALVDSRFQLGTQSASCSNCSAAPDCRADQIAKILRAGLSERCSGLADSLKKDHDS